MAKSEYVRVTFKVGLVTLIGNIMLSLGKLIVGALAHASSLISDGLHSLSDVLSTVVVMIGAKMAEKAPDKEHPYGHERFESVAGILLALILGITAFFIGYGGVTSIIAFAQGQASEVAVGVATYLALGFAITSIIIKGAMFVYAYASAKKIRSSLLKADAYHHLTDSISSVASTVGIIGLLCGGNLALLDPIASILIALFILKVAFDIALKAVNEVVDKAAPESVAKTIESLAKGIDGVVGINSLKTRLFGNKYYIELEIAVDGNLTVAQGHAIARSLHDAIESAIPEVKHCMIHVDPLGENPEE